MFTYTTVEESFAEHKRLLEWEKEFLNKLELAYRVIDVAAGEKIPRKGGPGITKSDLFVINKTDLAPHVGADLSVMEADTKRMRPNRPFVMTNLKTREGLDQVIRFIEQKGLLVQQA